MEAHLAAYGPYIGGAAVSCADMFMLMMSLFYRPFGGLFDRFLALRTTCRKLASLEPVRRTLLMNGDEAALKALGL